MDYWVIDELYKHRNCGGNTERGVEVRIKDRRNNQRRKIEKEDLSRFVYNNKNNI